jgi:hypothetical protein
VWLAEDQETGKWVMIESKKGFKPMRAYLYPPHLPGRPVPIHKLRIVPLPTQHSKVWPTGEEAERQINIERRLVIVE